MKKLLIVLIVVAMASFLFVGCIPITPPVDPDEPGLYLIGIEVDPKTMDLAVGESEFIDSVTACYELRSYGFDIDFEDCLFLTSDNKVATVDKDGLVTAVEVGIADILVSYKENIDTLKVTVTEPKSMEIIANMPLFEVGETSRFTVEIKANSDVGKKVLVYFTMPAEGPQYSVLYWDDDMWERLWPGDITFGGTGFPLIDEVMLFKASFNEVGTYITVVEVRTVPDDVPLCLEIISAVVVAPE